MCASTAKAIGAGLAVVATTQDLSTEHGSTWTYNQNALTFGAVGIAANTINGVALQPSDKFASDTSMSPQCHGGAHPDRVDFWRGNVASGDTIICTATCQPLGVFFKVQTSG